MRIRTILITATVVAMLAAPSSAMSAPTPTPAWALNVVSYPTNFEPGSVNTNSAGPGYRISATNVGGRPSSGTVTITDTLPVGLEAAPVLLPSATAGHNNTTEHLACSVTGRTVTCRGSFPVQPGAEIGMLVPVQVQPEAKAVLIDKATIEGGEAAAAASARTTTSITSESPSFDFLAGEAGLFGSTTNSAGGPVTQAGAHPYQEIVGGFHLPMLPAELSLGGSSLIAVSGGLRDLRVSLPKGAVVNPGATVKCQEIELVSHAAGCPAASQVGVMKISLSLAAGLLEQSFYSPVFNMVPPSGDAAELGFEAIEGVVVHLAGHVRNDGSFELAAEANDLLAKVPIAGVETQLWGDPTDESHDQLRGECATAEGKGKTCATERTGRAFLTMPSSCGGPLGTEASADSWMSPGSFVSRSYESTDLGGNPVGVEGCGALQFEPSIEATTTSSQGESPSGLQFVLHQTQHESAGELATANLKDATVTLPDGVTLNPAAANGREACSSAQIGVATASGVKPIRYVEEPAHCPAASKLGTAEVTTPLLKDEAVSGVQTPHVLKGSVYLAKPFDNPFGSLLGIYLVVEDEASGIIAKLAGKVTPDPTTGQLTTTFEESPELPLEDVRLELSEGQRAPLATPLTCGTKTTTSDLVPWSTPEGADAHPSATFSVASSCYGSEGDAPKVANFTAGTVSPLSGAYSPFVLRLSRPDGTQHITGLETTLPEGLLGKLAGVSYCPESGIAQAISREQPEMGKLEQAQASCPSSSEVGIVNVSAGVGNSPIPVSGHAYLAGPYKGAPLSLLVIVPAVAGPFDLGTVVDRVALNVGEYDARIHAIADPLPTIRDGIPLDVRSIELKLDRPNFTLNPTDCEVKAIEGSVSTQAGQTAALSNRFQVGGCGALGFKPSIAISLKGQTKRTGHPALTATVTYPKKGAYANIARAQVSLPHSEFLDQNNFGDSCTRPVLAAHACPPKSIYGKAKAWSPLLEKPLEGNVYLVGGYGYKLPALVAELNGQIRVLLVGKVDTGKNGGIRNTFEAVPDAPVSRFVLQLKGGKRYGLLINSEDLCKKEQKAQVSLTAQNGRKLNLQPKISNSCGTTKRKGRTKQ